MNRIRKAIVVACLMLAVLFLITGCGGEQTPYEVNNGEDYRVSIRYDANGGTFTTNTTVIVDSYNIGEMTAQNGTVSIPLLSPDDSRRGTDAFTAVNSGHFLAGWYASREEAADGTVTYGDKWDFATDTLAVDAAGDYSAQEPVLTLYAVWVPMFEVQFCSLEDGSCLSTYAFNPNTQQELLLPAWDDETGAIEMYDFPSRSGYTFEAAYYDAAGTQPITGTALTHTGRVDEATGTAENAVMKVYVQWREGEWYRISNAEQFRDNASVSGCYELVGDLDFSDEIWPSSLMYGNFSGTIIGNGHAVSNVTIEQTNNSKVNAGLFGCLTEEAELSDVTFANVTFTVKSGTRVAGTSYGLLAGTISGGAVLENVRITESQLLVDSGCYFGVEDYAIGLVCGMGDPDAVASWDITCAATGADSDAIRVESDGNAVTVEWVRE